MKIYNHKNERIRNGIWHRCKVLMAYSLMAGILVGMSIAVIIFKYAGTLVCR